MGLIKSTVRLRTVFAACACAVLLALAFSGARAADDKTYVMKLGTATINDAQHEWCKRFVAMVEKDSGGRIKGEIYPASQLGPIPREIEGVQFGAIQGYIGPPEFLVGIDHRYEVLSAPGLITDMAHGNPRNRRFRAAKDDVWLGRQQRYPWRRIVGFAAVFNRRQQAGPPSR